MLLAVLPPSRVVAAICPRECSLSMRFLRSLLLEFSNITSSFSAHTSVHDPVFLEVSLPNSLSILSDQSTSASSFILIPLANELVTARELLTFVGAVFALHARLVELEERLLPHASSLSRCVTLDECAKIWRTL